MSVSKSRSPYSSQSHYTMTNTIIGQFHWSLQQSFVLKPTKHQSPLTNNRIGNNKMSTQIDKQVSSGSKRWTRIQVDRGKSQWQVKCPEGYSPKNPRACVRAVTVLVLWRVWRYWGSTTTITITTTITLATTTSIDSRSNGTVVADVWRGSCYGGKLAVRARKRLSTYAPGYWRWASDTKWNETVGGRERKSEKERGVERGSTDGMVGRISWGKRAGGRV